MEGTKDEDPQIYITYVFRQQGKGSISFDGPVSIIDNNKGKYCA